MTGISIAVAAGLCFIFNLIILGYVYVSLNGKIKIIKEELKKEEKKHSTGQTLTVSEKL